MAPAINTVELERELGHTRNMFEQWSAQMQSLSQSCKSSHISKILASKAEMATLEERYHRAEKQAAQVRQQMAQDREHEQALQVTAESLLAEQHSLQKRLQQLQLEYETENDTAQKQQAGVDARRADVEQRLSVLGQVYDTYQGAFGLKLQPQNGGVYLEFTQIDPAQPEKTFGFAVKVLGDRYSVTHCNPAVPQLPLLEEQLSAGKIGFAGFVRAMRRQFSQIVEAEQTTTG